jgi:hypothetical protein
MTNLSLPNIDLPRVSRKTVALVAIPLIAIGTFAGLFNQVFFYNEAGQMAHVRTIFGEEKVVEDVGYATQWFGRTTFWKRTIGVQSALQGDTHASGNPTVTVGTLPIVFLGNVDAKAEFSTQFRMPTGEANTGPRRTSSSAHCSRRSRKPCRPLPR